MMNRSELHTFGEETFFEDDRKIVLNFIEICSNHLEIILKKQLILWKNTAI